MSIWTSGEYIHFTEAYFCIFGHYVPLDTIAELLDFNWINFWTSGEYAPYQQKAGKVRSRTKLLFSVSNLFDRYIYEFLVLRGMGPDPGPEGFLLRPVACYFIHDLAEYHLFCHWNPCILLHQYLFLNFSILYLTGLIIKWTSKTFEVTFRIVFIVSDPKDTLFTYFPSITSIWNQSALLLLTIKISSSSFPKSDASIEGAINFILA